MNVTFIGKGNGGQTEKEKMRDAEKAEMTGMLPLKVRRLPPPWKLERGVASSHLLEEHILANTLVLEFRGL